MAWKTSDTTEAGKFISFLMSMGFKPKTVFTGGLSSTAGKIVAVW